MCRRDVFSSLVDVCGMYVGNSLILMGGTAVNPLRMDGIADYNYEISHPQSWWFRALDVMYLWDFYQPWWETCAEFLILCIPMWALYSESDNQLVIFLAYYKCQTGKHLLLILLSDTCSKSFSTPSRLTWKHFCFILCAIP